LNKKYIAGLFALAVFSAVLFLTFQGPQETTSLSESVRTWIGYKGDSVHFRSDVHYIEYFIVGVASIVLAWTLGWRLWVGAIIACGFGLLDETFKIFLPTREFSGIDLIKDVIGIAVALGILTLVKHVKDKQKQ